MMITNACTNKSNTDAATRLNIHFPQVELILDPHKMEDAFSMTVVSQIHRGLLRYTPGGDVVPDLAKEWKESDDHRRYVFKLRGLHFSNGKQIEARHVQMSFARLFRIGAAIGADIEYIEGATEFRKSGDLSKLGIKIISPLEIEFRLKYPSALFLKHLAVTDCAILPLDDFNASLKFDENTGFSGPYKVVSLDKSGSVVVEKWRDDALESKSPPKELRFFPTTESPIALAKAGATDCLDHDPVSDEDKKRLLSERWTETATELIGETYVILNPKKVAADLRQAMVSVINPAEVAKLLGSKYTPAFGAIPRGVPGEMRQEDYPRLAPAVSSHGSVNLEFDPNNPVHQKVQPFLTKKWEAIGIKVNLVPLSKRDLLKRVFGNSCEVCIGQKGLDYPDGYSVLTYFKSNYESNYFYVKNHHIDSLIDKSGAILDKEKREQSYRKIQQLVLKEHTLLPLAFGSEASGLWSSKIKSVPPHVIGYHMLPFETVEMAGR